MDASYIMLTKLIGKSEFKKRKEIEAGIGEIIYITHTLQARDEIVIPK